MTCAERIRVVHPLFQAEGGGSTPTSALQLNIAWSSVETAIRLNELWHSRLPEVNYPSDMCRAFCAEFDGIYYASAIWSQPSARRLNNHGMYELRRLAIASDAPKNTASRMLRVMRISIARKMPHVRTLISYQDTEVHSGTIYRAAGWTPCQPSKVPADGWTTRSPNASQSNADKVRWELNLRARLGE